MPDIELRLMLSSDRNRSGLLIVQDAHSGHVLGQFEALGRGSQGNSDTQMQVNGNTPTGRYSVATIEDTASWNQSSYGPHGALRLVPVTGNALAAEQVAGRVGLLIHGGTPGGASYWRGANELRATHGCVRLSNDNMRQLVGLLHQATGDPLGNQSRAIEVTLTVTDHEASFVRP